MKSSILDRFLLKRKHPESSLECKNRPNKGGSTQKGNSHEENLASSSASNPTRNLNKEYKASAVGSNPRMEVSSRQKLTDLFDLPTDPKKREIIADYHPDQYDDMREYYKRSG